MPKGISVMVVVAKRLRIGAQLPLHEILRSLLGLPSQPGDHRDPQLCQGLLGSRADAAAEEDADAQAPQEAGQGAVALAGGGEDHGEAHLAVGDVVNLKGRGLAKMLENLAVFVGNR